jgi:hypothetical protein
MSKIEAEKQSQPTLLANRKNLFNLGHKRRTTKPRALATAIPKARKTSAGKAFPGKLAIHGGEKDPAHVGGPTICAKARRSAS